MIRRVKDGSNKLSSEDIEKLKEAKANLEKILNEHKNFKNSRAEFMFDEKLINEEERILRIIKGMEEHINLIDQTSNKKKEDIYYTEERILNLKEKLIKAPQEQKADIVRDLNKEKDSLAILKANL